MTDQEQTWLMSVNPAEMLPLLGWGPDDRKLRLFAIACCRRVWSLLPESAKHAVDVAERFAAGRADRNALTLANQAVAVLRTDGTYNPAARAAVMAGSVWGERVLADGAARNATLALHESRPWTGAEAAEMKAQAGLLRCIFGNPFRPVVVRSVVCPRCGTAAPTEAPAGWGNWCASCGRRVRMVSRAAPWLTRNVRALAESIERDRAYDRLPILADCLEEVGCCEAAILAHLRGLEPCLTCKGTGRRDVMVDAGYGNPLMQTHGWEHCYVCNRGGYGETPGWKAPRDGPAPHVKGCHVLDAILGRE